MFHRPYVLDEHSEGARDFHLEQRREAAEDVITAAYASGWFTDETLESALQNSSLRVDFVLALDRRLDGYKDENRGIWPPDAARLLRNFDAYLALDPNILPYAMRGGWR